MLNHKADKWQRYKVTRCIAEINEGRNNDFVRGKGWALLHGPK